MMKKALFAVVAVSVAGYGVYRWADDPAPREEASLVTNRIWLDHIPRNDRDVIEVFAAITDEPLGIFQATSMWKGHFEMFRYESHGDEFRILYPQNGERESVTMKATRCNQSGMDYCLEVSGSSRGVKQYYSRKGWEIDSVHDLASMRARLK